jgi:hypothetical protein
MDLAMRQPRPTWACWMWCLCSFQLASIRRTVEQVIFWPLALLIPCTLRFRAQLPLACPCRGRAAILPALRCAPGPSGFAVSFLLTGTVKAGLLPPVCHSLVCLSPSGAKAVSISAWTWAERPGSWPDWSVYELAMCVCFFFFFFRFRQFCLSVY